MAREKVVSSGKCSLCGGTFDKAAMTRHLKTCEQKMESSKAGRKTKHAFHLLVEGRYQPEYWMHIEAPADATLDTLDRFLRDTWLECCGHMSEFEIEGTRYPVEPMDLGDESMDVKLRDVLSPGTKFTYVYVFGSTPH